MVELPAQVTEKPPETGREIRSRKMFGSRHEAAADPPAGKPESGWPAPADFRAHRRFRRILETGRISPRPA